MITINLKVDPRPKVRQRQREKEERESERWKQNFLSTLEEKLAEDPTNPILYCEMGESILQDDVVWICSSSPEQYFEIAMHIDPTCGRAFLGLADYMAHFRYIDDEEESKAKRLEFLKKGVRHCPAKWRKLWDFMKETEDSEEQAYLAAIEAVEGNINSPYREVHAEYQSHCLNEGKKDNALEFYREAMERNPMFYRSVFIEFLYKIFDGEISKIYEELGQCEERAKEKASKPEEPKPQRRVAKEEEGLSSLGDMLFGGDEEVKTRKSLDFEAEVARKEELLAEFPFYPLNIKSFAGYLASGWTPDKTDFAEDKLKELIWKYPSEAAVYFEYARFLLNFSVQEATEQILIAVDELGFTPDSSSIGDYSIDKIIGMHHHDNGDFGKAAIAFERNRANSVPLPPPVPEEMERLAAGNFEEGDEAAEMLKKFESQLYEIYKERAMVKGKEFTDDNSLPELPKYIVTQKVDAIKQAREENCPYIEARELCLIGFYDEALQVLEGIDNKGAAEHRVAGDVYEAKWRKTGSAEFLEKSHDEYASASRHDPKDVDCITRLARTAKFLGRDDEVVGLWSIARNVGAKPEQMAKLERLLGSRLYIKLIEANEDPDLRKRIDALKEIDEECPGYASPSIAAAYREFAPVVAGQMRELLVRF